MDDQPHTENISPAQQLAERALATLQHYLHVETVSGVVLLSATAAALIWANSPYAHDYHALWQASFSIGLGGFTFAKPLHFLINDALMTVFFLVVGMEIRREIHEGALNRFDQAVLPLVAAVGGVIVPALIYVSLNLDPARSHGWAVPTATDIAFAVGILALLGRSIPSNVRVFLLALAIIDDIIAVLVIAAFYSNGIHIGGLAVASIGLVLVLGLQRMGIGSAPAYVIPGAIVWAGFLITGVHPTLAGVVLGLMTPVRSRPMRENPLQMLSRLAADLRGSDAVKTKDAQRLEAPLRQIRVAQREVLPPVVRVQTSLHPWVAYGIMPLFALANAGVELTTVDLSAAHRSIVLGVGLALVVGKPLGVIGATWLAVRTGACRLPPGVSWGGVGIVGLLAGIGFTMSIFIAMLAFSDEASLNAAKVGVFAGSLVAAILGLGWGAWYVRRSRGGADAASGT